MSCYAARMTRENRKPHERRSLSNSILRGLVARVVVRERRGQFAVGVGLGKQVFGLLFDGLDGVGTGGPAQRRLVLARKLNERLGELGRVTALQAVHSFPSCDGLSGFIGVVV